MKADGKEQETIRQYLLGQTPEEGFAHIEEKLLSDGDFYEELLIAEDELIDQYLSNLLSEPERLSFETHFLSPLERQQKVRFARSLRRYVGAATVSNPDEETRPVELTEPSDVAKPPPRKRSWFSFLPAQNPIVSYSLAAAVLLVIFGASWVAINNWRNPGPRDPGAVLAVTLSPGLIRGEAAITRIRLAPGIGTVQLRLDLPRTDYVSYRCVLLADDRSEVWTEASLLPINESGKNLVIANVPARLLPPSDYQVKVSGRLSDGSLEDIATYSFRVAS